VDVELLQGLIFGVELGGCGGGGAEKRSGGGAGWFAAAGRTR
jgi:hypothetical protein